LALGEQDFDCLAQSARPCAGMEAGVQGRLEFGLILIVDQARGGSKFLDSLRILVLGPKRIRKLRVHYSVAWIVSDNLGVKFVRPLKLPSIVIGVSLSKADSWRERIQFVGSVFFAIDSCTLPPMPVRYCVSTDVQSRRWDGARVLL
jgi:hypothetical protein